MCVIRKEAPQNNLLGNRFISGRVGMVASVGAELQSSSSSTPSQIANDWTVRIIPPDEDVLRLEKEIAKRNEDVLRLEKEIAKRNEDVLRLEKEIAKRNEDVMHLEDNLQRLEKEVVLLAASRDAILDSLSWKITKPLRFVGRHVKKSLRIFGV
jgi:septal ring factor EnvC (AmiA/AmiB activator)